MNSTTWLSIAIALAVAVGVPSTVLAQGSLDEWNDDLGTCQVGGDARFEGTPPPRFPIERGGYPQCVQAHPDPLLEESAVVGPDGGLANVFVYVKEGVHWRFPAPSDPAQIAQQGCQYVPHVLGVRVGQSVQIHNGDRIPHNVNSLGGSGNSFNFTQTSVDTTVQQFRRPEVMVHLICNVHGWMGAYVGVVTHPFFAVTGPDGRWSFPVRLPPGEYVVEAWHERFGTATERITVAPGQADLALAFAFHGQAGTAGPEIPAEVLTVLPPELQTPPEDPSEFTAGWLPPDISTHGSGVDALMRNLHYFMFLLFVGWGIFMTYCLVRFRQRPAHAASTTPLKGTLPKSLEVGVVVIEVILLVGFSIPVWARVRTDFPEDPNALVVRVVAEQFKWNFHYAGPDGVFGRTDPSLITPTNLLGLDRSDPHARDDVTTVNDLHVVVDRPVICHITSKDVIHSFNIPVMRIKMDAIPGMDNPVWFEATRRGTFQIACAQLCGNLHATMAGYISVDTPERFRQWMAGLALQQAR